MKKISQKEKRSSDLVAPRCKKRNCREKSRLTKAEEWNPKEQGGTLGQGGSVTDPLMIHECEASSREGVERMYSVSSVHDTILQASLSIVDTTER